MIRLSEYSTLPTMDVRRGVALGASLVNAVPAQAPESVKESGRQVLVATAALQKDSARMTHLGPRTRGSWSCHAVLGPPGGQVDIPWIIAGRGARARP